MGCSANSQTNGTPALFETKAEAEKAAKNFNCTGAHKMGKKWMPCQSHADHDDTEKHNSHNSHHHRIHISYLFICNHIFFGSPSEYCSSWTECS